MFVNGRTFGEFSCVVHIFDDVIQPYSGFHRQLYSSPDLKQKKNRNALVDNVSL